MIKWKRRLVIRHLRSLNDTKSVAELRAALSKVWMQNMENLEVRELLRLATRRKKEIQANNLNEYFKEDEKNPYE